MWKLKTYKVWGLDLHQVFETVSNAALLSATGPLWGFSSVEYGTPRCSILLNSTSHELITVADSANSSL